MVLISNRTRESEDVGVAAQREMIARTVLGESCVWGILGYRGTGKGVYGSYLAWQAYLKGVQILHLGNLTFGEQVSPVDLASQDPRDLGGCLLFVDESRLVLPSQRTGSIYQLLVTSNLVQSRHQTMSVLWTAQFERGVGRDITEQTDWIINIKSRRRWWTTDAAITSGKVPPERDNRCAAWRPDEPGHRNHIGFVLDGVQVLNDCREMPHQFTIYPEYVSQWGNPLGPGVRQEKILHCAQRFFPLSHTAYKVDAMESMLLSADQVRDEQEQAIITRVRDLLIEARKRFDRVTPANLAEYLAANVRGVAFTRNRLGRMMTFLGVPRPRVGKTNQVFYDIAEWNPLMTIGGELDDDGNGAMESE